MESAYTYKACEWIDVTLVYMEGAYIISLYPAKLVYLNFHPLEVVSRYPDPQLQVGENYSYLFWFEMSV